MLNQTADLGWDRRVARFFKAELTVHGSCFSQHSWRKQGARLREETGSELVETALVLPLYFMLVFGITSFAIFLFAYGNATFATRSAVRYAVVHSSTSLSPCTTANILSIVNPLLWGAPSGNTVVPAPVYTPSNTIGSVVSVTVRMTYTNGLPYTTLTGLVVSVTSQGTILH